MSDLEAKIKITAQNETAAGFDGAADAAAAAAKQIEDAIANVKARIQAQMADVRKAFQEGLHFNPDSLKDVGAAQKAVFRKITESAKRMYLETRTPMEKFKSELALANKLLEVGAIDVEVYQRKVKQLNEDLKKAESAAGGFAGVIGRLKGLFAGFALVSFAKGMAETADKMQVLDNQVRQTTAGEAEFAAVKGRLLQVANQTRADLSATTELYVKSSRALKDYGYSQEEVLKFTEATNNAMTIGGVAAEQQSAALLQLSQALGSGVLQGDEFKSIAEAAPILLDTIAEYMGKSRVEIKKLGSEGKLTADVIFQAISGSAEKFAEQAAKMPMTMGNALQIFRNNWQSLVGDMMNGTGIMSRVAAVIAFVANHLKELVGAAVLVGIAMLVQSFGGLTIAVGGLTGAVQGLWTLMAANPLVAATALVVGLLAATGNLGEAMDVLGSIASDVFDLIRTGYEGLGGLIEAVYNDMTSAGSDSADGQTAAFGGFFSDTGEGFTGLLEKIGKVFDAFGAIIRAAVVWAIESFGDLWAAIQNGAAAAAKAAISSIENLVNSTIKGINRVIELANKVPGIGIGTVGEVNLVGKGPVQNTPKVGRSFDEIYAEEAARQQQGGWQKYFAGKRQSGKSAGGGGGGGSSRRSVPSGGGGGGRGRGGGGSGGSGGKNDQIQKWEAEIKAQKLAHEEMRVEGKTHTDWDLNRERAYWKEKLSLVDAGGKDGVKIREKIVSLEHSLAKQSTEAKLRQVEEWEKADKYRLDLEAEAADQALSAGRISQLERLDLEIEFENRRYQIAYDALQERIALAEQDPTYSAAAVEKLKQQVGELDRGHSLNQEKNQGKREQQRRKDAPSLVEMLQDGGKNVWEEAQQQMGQAFSAMLSRAQNFRTAMNNFFKSMGQTFIQEMVTKPLAGMMQRMVQESAIYKMIFGTKEALETAAKAKTVANKAEETKSVVGSNATQAASGAASSQASIPYVGPILAVAAMAAMMAAVMGLMGGGGGGGSTTTTTRIPSAAGGWDIPAGINPLTQLHENEMVLPAEHAQTIRDMAGQGGGGDTIVINTTGGDFIHKKDLAKLLKQLNRDFKIA
nr:MAG TPA: Tail tape measure [Caudoviricetes sp.]